jgi:putative N-acetyltransferase (TIGR04045 family)
VNLEIVRPFRSRDVSFHAATEPWEDAAYYALRRRIFCGEQGLFEGDDRDSIDEFAAPIVAVTRVFGMPDQVVGVVRIWEETPAHFWGGRLGVHPDFRKNGTIGSGLVRLAVRTACERGCARFFANVQVRNVKLFERLDFRVVGETEIRGAAHALMEADLGRYRQAEKPGEVVQLGARSSNGAGAFVAGERH